MRFGNKIEFKGNVVKQYFALWPVSIDGETRWLERVKVEGYYWKGQSETIYWKKIKFID